MKTYFENKAEAVAYVNDRLDTLRQDSPLTMTITRGSFGVYSVQTAIDESSEDIERLKAKFFSDTQVNT